MNPIGNEVVKNDLSQPERMETETTVGNEEILENQLLSDSVTEVQSCSSSILNTPKRDDVKDVSMLSDSDDDDGINVTIRTAVTGGSGDKPSADSASKIKWRKNISKTKRNKIKKLLETGLSMEEARRQVLSNVVSETPNSAKRSRDGDQGSSVEKQDVKRAKSNLCPKVRAGLSVATGNQAGSKKETDQSEGKVDEIGGVAGLSNRSSAFSNSGGRSFKDVASQVKIGIIVKDYPKVQMTTAELDAVQDALLWKIEEQRNEAIKPKFAKSSYKNGYLSLVCKDQVTATWLKDVTKTLTPWENAELIALDEKDVPRPEMFHAFFPLSADFSNERLMRLIESQNDEISTAGWRILNRSNANRHAEWTLNIDVDSLKTLSERNFVLNFRFGETQLRKVKTLAQRSTDSTADANPITEDANKGSCNDTVGASLKGSTKGNKDSGRSGGRHSASGSGTTGDLAKTTTNEHSRGSNDGPIAGLKGKEQRSNNQNETH